ncbi:hypothetical protein Pla123a_36720 [Posidoniimonas polymericola]|uniref:Ice-binding protein C-terminal domain-containing protein n=1 Tax=Posidoniimonas polymericola TaxID=2528002 RepID=A0A5C5YFI6_9BACT|nr:PEP-CTERM sorting domain-containing protein [Posidoniimonas polymericola]TWT73778.1 hypothetical protein Pla123a_36720 [Posidoniimonas polymericola]
MRLMMWACAAMAALLTTNAAFAAPVVLTNEAPGGGAPGDVHDPTSAGGPDTFSASSTDLLQGLIGVYSGNSNAGSLGGDYPHPMAEVSTGAAAWTDGILVNYYPGDVDGDGSTSNDLEDFAVFHNGFGTVGGNGNDPGYVTFDLGGLFNLTGVDVFTGWNDGGRDDMSFNVQVAGNDGVFATIDSFAKTDDGNAGTVPTNYLSFDLAASAVRYLQLEVTDADNGYVGIMEIDAFGSRVPEPAALGLACLAGVGLIGRRRR